MSSSTLLRQALRFRRIATDALFALAVFVFLVVATSSDRSAAGSVRPNDFVGLSDSARETASGLTTDMPRSAASLTLVAVPDAPLQRESVFRRTEQQPAVFVLAAVFSLLAAANLAFLRHLRRVSRLARRSRT